MVKREARSSELMEKVVFAAIAERQADKIAVHDAEDKLANAFLSFRRVANNLNDRIDVSIDVSTVPPVKKQKGKPKNSKARKILKEIWKQHNNGQSKCDEKVPSIDFIEQRLKSDLVARKILAMDETATRELDTQALEQILVGHMMAIAGEANQIFRPVTMFDHGIDGEVEFKDNDGKASGKRIYIQLKSGNSYLRIRKGDGREVFDVTNDRHLEYWVNQRVDVYLIIRQTDEMRGDRTIRWMNVAHYLKARKDKKCRQIIFDGEKLDMKAVYKVRDGFFPS